MEQGELKMGRITKAKNATERDVVRQIHVSARFDSPSTTIAGKDVPLFGHIFRVLMNDAEVPEHGAVVAVMYYAERAQMLKAFWVCSHRTAEELVSSLPAPTALVKYGEAKIVRPTMMSNVRWYQFLNDWLRANDSPAHGAALALAEESLS